MLWYVLSGLLLTGLQGGLRLFSIPVPRQTSFALGWSNRPCSLRPLLPLRPSTPRSARNTAKTDPPTRGRSSFCAGALPVASRFPGSAHRRLRLVGKEGIQRSHGPSCRRIRWRMKAMQFGYIAFRYRSPGAKTLIPERRAAAAALPRPQKGTLVLRQPVSSSDRAESFTPRFRKGRRTGGAEAREAAGSSPAFSTRTISGGKGLHF